MIVDTYQTLGECLPQFKQYESLFRNPDMQRVLEYVYDDILEFHRKALKIFRHRGKHYENNDEEIYKLIIWDRMVLLIFSVHLEGALSITARNL